MEECHVGRMSRPQTFPSRPQLSSQRLKATTSRILTGWSGSSLSMTNSQHSDSQLARYSITTSKQDPGCSVAGNGFLISLKWRRLRLKPTSNTRNLQSPALQMETVFRAIPRSTSPKYVEPVTATLPAGTWPDASTRRDIGSMVSRVYDGT